MSDNLNITASNVVSRFDARPFFEKALSFGVQNGILTPAKLALISEEAPKGMVQIARYFGSEFLRPEIELARERMVNLISLHLEDASGGDLREAAGLLRDQSLLSRSKAGSDMLKALIVMPQNTHFGMNERGNFADRHITQLARWSLASYAEFKAERVVRQRVAQVVDAALWLADRLGVSADDLQDAEPDAEAVIRTALLVLASRRTSLPDWVAFEKMVLALRKRSPAVVAASLTVGQALPTELASAVSAVQQSVLVDLPRLLDARVSIRKLFDQTPSFMGRYFWFEDGLSEVNEHDRARSAKWEKLVGGYGDDNTLLTLFLTAAAASTPKTLLSEKAALALIRKIRKAGVESSLALGYIEARTPEQHHEDYRRLWLDFIAEAGPVLLRDRDSKLGDALALLRRECNVV